VDRLLLPFAAVAIVIAGYRVVAAQCRRFPSRCRWFIIGSVAAIVVAGLLVPWFLAKLDPPFSESPAGVFVYLGKGAVVGLLGLGGLGALAGALRSTRAGDPTGQ
jgi:bacteriorhodopsin